MAKNYIGNNTLSSLMKNVLGIVPSSVITDDETQQMWDGLDKPVIEVAPDGELSNWDYTLDETNKTVTLNKYKNTTATDVTVYGKYQLNGVEYDTKIKNSASDSYSSYANYLFGNKRSIQTVTFKEGINTSDVTGINGMFYSCAKLTTINGLENLDVSNVTNMNYVFNGCLALTSLDLTGWDTSNVTDMSNMFTQCRALTSLDLTGWDTSNVTDMSNMFSNCTLLTEIKGLQNWNTSNLISANNLFDCCESLTSLDLTGWDTSNVENMEYMFNCTELSSIKGLDSFNTSNVINMNMMFNGCRALTTLDLSKWDTSKVTNMYNMFNGCSSLTTLDLTGWDTSNVTNMSNMFGQCKELTSLDLTSFDTSKVTNMYNMFNGCSSLTSLDLTSFDTSKVTNINCIFQGCSALTEVLVTVGKWTLSDTCSSNNMFNNAGCSNVTHLDECIYDTTDHCVTCGLLNPEHVHSYESVVTDPTCIESGYTTHTCSVCGDTYVDSEVDALGHEYDESGYCVRCGKLNPELIEVGSEEELEKFFYSLNDNDNTVTIKDYHGSSETDVTVYGAYEIQTGLSTKKYYTIIDRSLFQDKSNVTSITFKPGITASSMNTVFAGCTSLTTINGLENIDVSNVKSMLSMFANCTSLTSLDLTGWDISNTSVDMECAFQNCTALTEIKVTTGKWGNEYISCREMMFSGCGCKKFTYVDAA